MSAPADPDTLQAENGQLRKAFATIPHHGDRPTILSTLEAAGYTRSFAGMHSVTTYRLLVAPQRWSRAA